MSSNGDIKTGPQIQFATQSSDGFSVQAGPPSIAPLSEYFIENGVSQFKYSPFGKYLVLHQSDRIRIIDSSTSQPKLVREFQLPSMMDTSFSPKETYLSILTRYVKPADSSTPPPKNHFIYNIETGDLVYSLTQKALSNWDVKWLEDESRFACLANNEIQFFDPSDQSKGVVSRLKIDGVKSFSLSPGKRPAVAAFIPEKKGQPASVRVYDVVNASPGSTPLSSISFYRADSASFFWNDIGTNVLVLAHTDVDATGQSYYGETSLYYLSISGSFDCRVELNKPGPIHDVTWSPNAREFIVIYGTMPAKATVFDNRASPMFELGSAPRNQVQYNKHGRLFFLGGFGNLAGDVDVWDRRSFKKIASIQASNSSFCDWSPDGRYIMTGTLWRRLKVDNGVKIWHHSGVLVHEWSVKELAHACWKPEKADAFPERTALSPPPAGLQTATPPKKAVGKYVPPSARNRVGMQSIYDRDLLDSNPSLGKKNTSKGVPGMNKSQGDKRTNKSNAQKENPSSAKNGVGAVPGGVLDIEKKIKNVNKKLKQIQDLKAKKAQGATLELTQLQKIDNEAALIKELQELNLTLNGQ